jgi:hypothetical protein
VSSSGRRGRRRRLGAEHRTWRRRGRVRRPRPVGGGAGGVVPRRTALGTRRQDRGQRRTAPGRDRVRDPLAVTRRPVREGHVSRAGSAQRGRRETGPRRGGTPSSRFDRSRPHSSGPRPRLTARPFHGSDDPRSGRCTDRSQGTSRYFTIRLAAELVTLRPSGDPALRRSPPVSGWPLFCGCHHCAPAPTERQ